VFGRSALQIPAESRHLLGLQPVWSRKTRLKWDRLLKPQDSAMSVMGRDPDHAAPLPLL